MKLRTIEDVRAEFQATGVPIAQWAVANGFSPTMVYHILSGTRKGLRGEAHNIAVKLGLKEGVICANPARALDAPRRRPAATATAGV
ncbi:DNA-binding protein [Alcaligenaceae bacterium]|nr:DNA-binding protein [Alcaligenaceae bacterium]